MMKVRDSPEGTGGFKTRGILAGNRDEGTVVSPREIKRRIRLQDGDGGTVI